MAFSFQAWAAARIISRIIPTPPHIYIPLTPTGVINTVPDMANPSRVLVTYIPEISIPVRAIIPVPRKIRAASLFLPPTMRQAPQTKILIPQRKIISNTKGTAPADRPKANTPEPNISQTGWPLRENKIESSISRGSQLWTKTPGGKVDA